jgi:hypothetical protein
MDTVRGVATSIFRSWLSRQVFFGIENDRLFGEWEFELFWDWKILTIIWRFFITKFQKTDNLLSEIYTAHQDYDFFATKILTNHIFQVQSNLDIT